MLTLHHLNQSRSLRILWLLEELKAEYGTPYQLVMHERTKSNLAPQSLKAIHPLAKSPILIDDELGDEPILLESGFMIEYLLKKYDINQVFGVSNQTSGDKGWRAYHFWLHFSEASMMPPLVMKLVFKGIVGRVPFFVKPVVKSIKSNLDKMWLDDTIKNSADMLEQALQGNEYLAGKFTGADVQAYFAAKAISKMPDFAESYPNIQKWLTRLEARKAYQSAVNLGGALQF